MKKIIAVAALLSIFAATLCAQDKTKIYDESIDPMVQIDQAVAKAAAEGKFVICQLGGNWCPWCIKFAKFVSSDAEICQLIADNYVYIHVNYSPSRSDSREKQADRGRLLKRLGNAGRFGFPVLVVLNGQGDVVHIQDSSLLEEGDGYNRGKVLRFFKNWTPALVLMRRP